MTKLYLLVPEVLGFLVLHLLQSASIPSPVCVTREFGYLLQNWQKIGAIPSLEGVTRRLCHLLHLKTTK